MAEHDHGDRERRIALRVEALEAILAEKGLVSTASIDALVRRYEHEVGPMNGARVIARLERSGVPAAPPRGWNGRGRRARLRGLAVRARGGGREHTARAQRGRVHALLVLPVAAPWPAALVVQEPCVPLPRGTRAARGAARDGPRAVREHRDLGLGLELRYLVLPERPIATAPLDEAALARWVTRDAMIGVGQPRAPAG